MFQNRLASKITWLISAPESVKKIQGDVYLITFPNREPLVLKGFSSYERWKRQTTLTTLLKQKGFTHTYEIYHQPKPFELERKWYGSMEYLPPNKNKFSFADEKSRFEALTLLANFHKHTETILIPLPKYDQVRKWEDRLQLFKKNVALMKQQVPEGILEDWVKWGEWSLQGYIENEERLYTERDIITHGDCAHHNFLRKADGTLALIDFDLISSAPKSIDYLQYANRILPHLTNPAKELWNYPEIAAYKDNPAFLYGLAYPSDIFREWNLVFKSHFHPDHAWKLSVSDYKKRMDFNEHIKELLTK